MSTPKCINCGAKFAHNAATASCNVCGLPDEIIQLGMKGVRRWEKFSKRREGLTKRQIKMKARPSTNNKKRRSHGRQAAA